MVIKLNGQIIKTKTIKYLKTHGQKIKRLEIIVRGNFRFSQNNLYLKYLGWICWLDRPVSDPYKNY